MFRAHARFDVQWPSLVQLVLCCMERFTMELIAQIVVINVTLIVITAFVARFGIEALAGYGLASRLELLISSSVLAFGLGTTTKVGICVGAGLVERARRVTFVSCALVARYIRDARIWRCRVRKVGHLAFYQRRRRGLCRDRLFSDDRTDLRVYGSVSDAVFCVSRLGQGDHSPFRQPAKVSHGSVGWMDSVYAIPRLDWLYYLVAGFVILAALALASIFLFWPPNRSSGVLSSGKGDR